jgi:hypothetical protein
VHAVVEAVEVVLLVDLETEEAQGHPLGDEDSEKPLYREVEAFTNTR